MHTIVCSWVIGRLIPYPDYDQCSFSKGKKNAHGLGCFSSLYFIYFITTQYLLETKHHIVPEDMWNYFLKKKKKSNFFFKHECGLSNYNFKNATNLG